MTACPICRSRGFYLKDPDDEYETFEFDLKEDSPVFREDNRPTFASDTLGKEEIFCEQCAWHGKFAELK
jgi:hypothetical protein